MSNQPTIRRVLSFFFLVLFAFSLTPKTFLHTLIANHEDIRVNTSDGKAQITENGFRCDVENTVAESPFDDSGIASPEIIAPVFFLTHQQRVIPFIYSETNYVKGLRGPPQV